MRLYVGAEKDEHLRIGGKDDSEDSGWWEVDEMKQVNDPEWGDLHVPAEAGS